MQEEGREEEGREGDREDGEKAAQASGDGAMKNHSVSSSEESGAAGTNSGPVNKNGGQDSGHTQRGGSRVEGVLDPGRSQSVDLPEVARGGRLQLEKAQSEVGGKQRSLSVTLPLISEAGAGGNAWGGKVE